MEDIQEPIPIIYANIYCSKCRTKTENKNETTELKNNRSFVKADCVVCETKKHSFIPNTKKVPPPEDEKYKKVKKPRKSSKKKTDLYINIDTLPLYIRDLILQTL